MAKYDYDLVVIGGGMAGLPAAKIAAVQYKKKVALLDYPFPSKNGATFPSPGGVCMVAGCVPKKMMVTASSLRRKIDCDSETFGILGHDNKRLQFNKKYDCDWAKAMTNVKNTLKKMSDEERKDLESFGISYILGRCKFEDDHTLSYAPDGEKFTGKVTAERIIIACGCRPRLVLDEECPGAEKYTSSTDDFFNLKFTPESVLIIGSGFIGIEFAGFMAGSAGINVTVMVRDYVLGNMDQDMVSRMVNDMVESGIVRLVKPCVCARIIQIEAETKERPPVYRVYGRDPDEKKGFMSFNVGDFNVILLAIGRDKKATTSMLNVEKAGIKLDKMGQVETKNFKTNVPHIYAVGDICSEDRIILAPVSARCARVLVTNIYEGTDHHFDWATVPRTVYASVQYGTCGLTENEALKKFGNDAIEVYHLSFRPYEWSLSAYTGRRKDKLCYCKLIVETKSIPGKEKIVGYHYFGPFACDIMIFTSCHLKLGLTKDELDAMIPVHPSNAARFIRLKIKKTVKGDSDKNMAIQDIYKLPKGPLSFTRA